MQGATRPIGVCFRLLAADAAAALGCAWQWVGRRGAAAAEAAAHTDGAVRATADRAGSAVSSTAARTWGAVLAAAAHTGGAIWEAAAATNAAAAGAFVSAWAAVVTAGMAVAHGGRVAMQGMALATIAGLTSLVPFLADVQSAGASSIPSAVFSESGWPAGTVESVVRAAVDAVDVVGPDAADAVTFRATVENWSRLAAALGTALRVGVALAADEFFNVLCLVSGG